MTTRTSHIVGILSSLAILVACTERYPLAYDPDSMTWVAAPRDGRELVDAGRFADPLDAVAEREATCASPRDVPAAGGQIRFRWGFVHGASAFDTFACLDSDRWWTEVLRWTPSSTGVATILVRSDPAGGRGRALQVNEADCAASFAAIACERDVGATPTGVLVQAGVTYYLLVAERWEVDSLGRLPDREVIVEVLPADSGVPDAGLDSGGSSGPDAGSDLREIINGALAMADVIVDGKYADFHLVSLPGGVPVTITLRASPAFDPVLFVFDTASPPNELAFNDDAIGVDSQVVFVPPSNATYSLAVTSFDPGETGPYTITIAY